MKEIFMSVLEQLRLGRDVIMITIIDCKGSAPRGAGARMWVADEQHFGGTIGGGIIENLAIQRAHELLKECKSYSREYNLDAEDAAGIGMVCGGRIRLSYLYISCKDAEAADLLKRITEQYEKRENTWLTIAETDEKGWSMTIDMAGPVSRPVLIQGQQGICYTEPIVKAERVCVFGGGHVAKELVLLLTKVGFCCVVFDDRPEFANRQRFPLASNVICSDYDRIDDELKISNEDYVIIITRGHKHDLQVQKWALKHKPYYIGVMGSRRKIAYVTEQLMNSGYERKEIENCHMPIGLPINAETPAELAVSIAGELIRMRSMK